MRGVKPRAPYVDILEHVKAHSNKQKNVLVATPAGTARLVPGYHPPLPIFYALVPSFLRQVGRVSESQQVT